MELLTITHEDFVLIIECSKFDEIWRKATANIGTAHLHSTYSWTDGVMRAEHTANGAPIVIEKDSQAPAIFFDNTDYPIWVEFKGDVTTAQFGSQLQSEVEKFSFRRHILTGFINYGNEIGKSEINLVYKQNGKQKKFTFSFEVLSSKLNYHEHWRNIIEDIEREYKMLSLDYLRRTFHGFTPDAESETPEIVWWSIFKAEQEKFVKAVQNIIDRPRHRLHGYETYKRADQLKRVPALLENELAAHRNEQAHLYRVEEQLHTNDTNENRFLKFALAQITQKYNVLRNRIVGINNVSEENKREMKQMADTLTHLQRNPFFRTVGRYKGMQQESLVLQKATGYNQVYRTWNLLRRGYSLQDGLYRLETKDIATLYEIWCFIEVSHIVKEQLHLNDTDIDHRNRMEMNGLFTWELGKGEHSRILFCKNGVELAELIYNPKSTERENSIAGVDDLVAPTVPQKPDILLQLTKSDVQKNMKMTYLFDAKYRIGGRTAGVDTPPDDAINQMHRYRDAIYYKEHQNGRLKKEVIGGYILFPGNGEPADVAVSNFYKNIDEINIGAFPLRPKNEQNRKLLEEFVETLIASPSQHLIKKVIPQKGTFVDVGNRVLIGLVNPNSRRKGYVESFETGTAELYYTGPIFPTTIYLENLHYFIPYFKEKGIRDVYEIVRIRTITGKEAKGDDEKGNDLQDVQEIDSTTKITEEKAKQDNKELNDLRLAFKLKFNRRLYSDYQMINTSKMSYNSFISTTFDGIDEYIKKPLA